MQNLTVFAILYVATIYFMGAVEPTLQAHLSSITPASLRGAVFGIHTTVASLGWFVAPLAASGISIGATLRHVFLVFRLSLAATGLVITVANVRLRLAQA